MQSMRALKRDLCLAGVVVNPLVGSSDKPFEWFTNSYFGSHEIWSFDARTLELRVSNSCNPCSRTLSGDVLGAPFGCCFFSIAKAAKQFGGRIGHHIFWSRFHLFAPREKVTS